MEKMIDDLEISEPSVDEVRAIYELIKIYSTDGLILERAMEDIMGSRPDFLVARSSGRVVGAVSFYDYGPSLKEIRSLSVSKSLTHQGTGSLLLKTMIERIRVSNDVKIFVLTYSPDFFLKNGFTAVERETLPEKIWKDCNNCNHKDHCDETAMVYAGPGRL